MQHSGLEPQSCGSQAQCLNHEATISSYRKRQTMPNPILDRDGNTKGKGIKEAAGKPPKNDHETSMELQGLGRVRNPCGHSSSLGGKESLLPAFSSTLTSCHLPLCLSTHHFSYYIISHHSTYPLPLPLCLPPLLPQSTLILIPLPSGSSGHFPSCLPHTVRRVGTTWPVKKHLCVSRGLLVCSRKISPSL